MTAEKCLQLYDEFVRLLREHRFDWVVAEVEEQIRLGKTAEERIVVSEEFALEITPEADTRRARGRPGRTRFLKCVDYTARERLLLIIDAVEHAVLDVGEMGLHLLESFQKLGVQGPTVSFVPDVEGGEAKPFPASDLNLMERQPAIDELRSLLNELKTEVTRHGD